MERQIAKAKTGKDKQATYARYLSQYNKAMRYGFYLEAIMIDYAMMEDRLVALLHYLGIVTRTHEKLAVNKFCRADVRRLLGYKENVGIKITNISIKVKLLESLMNTADPVESQFISAVRVHIDSNTKRDEISLLCEDIIMWSKIRNQYVHALLGKNYEALQEGLHEFAENGYKIARRIDDCVKAIKKNSQLRRKFNIQ